MRFESLVNTEGFQTKQGLDADITRLRVLLIQKDFKQNAMPSMMCMRLRVLLIQKDFKLNSYIYVLEPSLRVLLIPKYYKLKTLSSS